MSSKISTTDVLFGLLTAAATNGLIFLQLPHSVTARVWTRSHRGFTAAAASSAAVSGPDAADSIRSIATAAEAGKPDTAACAKQSSLPTALSAAEQKPEGETADSTRQPLLAGAVSLPTQPVSESTVEDGTTNKAAAAAAAPAEAEQKAAATEAVAASHASASHGSTHHAKGAAELAAPEESKSTASAKADVAERTAATEAAGHCSDDPRVGKKAESCHRSALPDEEGAGETGHKRKYTPAALSDTPNRCVACAQYSCRAHMHRWRGRFQAHSIHGEENAHLWLAACSWLWCTVHSGTDMPQAAMPCALLLLGMATGFTDTEGLML